MMRMPTKMEMDSAHTIEALVSSFNATGPRGAVHGGAEFRVPCGPAAVEGFSVSCSSTAAGVLCKFHMFENCLRYHVH